MNTPNTKQLKTSARWDEETNTFYRATQIDENTVLSEPITAEEYYKSKNY